MFCYEVYCDMLLNMSDSGPVARRVEQVDHDRSKAFRLWQARAEFLFRRSGLINLLAGLSSSTICCVYSLRFNGFTCAPSAHTMPSNFPGIQGGGSLILAWQIKNKNVLVVGGGEVRSKRTFIV